MALVHKNDVERLDRNRRIVGDRDRFLVQLVEIGERRLLILLGQLLALKHRIQPLDRADTHPRDRVDSIAREPLDVVQLRELAAVVRRHVLLELPQGLSAEVGAVHEEQHASRAPVLHESIDRRDGGERLAAAGRHLDQRPRPVFGE